VVNISTFFTQKDFFFYLVFTTMYIIGYFLTRRKYRLMSEEKLDSQSILSYLKSNRAAIKSALQVERIWGICAILLAAVYYINVGDVYMLNNPIGITIFLLIIVIFGFWAEWMNHKKFGRRIKNLEENIIRLETLS